MKLFGAAILALSYHYSDAAEDIAGLPWSELEERVGDRLIHTSIQDFVNECYPEFTIFPRGDRTNHNLIDQPSGLCVGHLFCAFNRCSPETKFLNGHMNTTEYMFEYAFPFMIVNEGYSPEEFDEANGIDPAFGYAALLKGWLDDTNPAYNLPSKVLFPRTAGDVVASVEFAKTHGAEISVKNSGHSYAGSSAKANTLHVNMNQYKRYAIDDIETYGIVECTSTGQLVDSTENSTVNQDMSNQACLLTVARGKNAFIRVGGGENFDKLYRSVTAFNERGGNKYHVVGGAAGTVSPMGWTWQGGLAGTTGGRRYGFGVDQVLQIEAVLPNGEHVRFGPTQWEDDEGYFYPRTTKVSGVCNENPEDEEVNWIWSNCPEETSALFDDLWFAFRGGGGGTWGIVLSVYLQLHDYLPVMLVRPSDACLAAMYQSNDTSLGSLAAEFAIDYYLDPEALNMTREQSSTCSVNDKGPGYFWCYSEDPTFGEGLISVYKEFVSKHSERLTQEMFQVANQCLTTTTVNSFADTETFLDGPHEGKVQDTNKPSYASDLTMLVNQLLPKAWILNNKKKVADYWAAGNSIYLAFGGNAEFAHDQTTSLSIAHREAGGMIFYTPSVPGLPGNGDIVEPWIPEMYNFTSGVIPPYTGHNHLGPDRYGPLKDDPSKPCPIYYLTSLEAETMCHSAQESIFGTEALERLESIKMAVDPNGMFDCFRCIGNTVSVAPTLDTTKEESPPAADEMANNESSSITVVPEYIPDAEIDDASKEPPSAAVDQFGSSVVIFAAMMAISFNEFVML